MVWCEYLCFFCFFSSRRRHTRYWRDWSSDVCSSDLEAMRRGACDFVQKPWDNNRLLATIRKQAEPARRQKSELEIAANVQQQLFPRKLRHLESLDYAGHCMPAREVGGDYYDFLEMPGGN